jgi:transposase
MNTKASFDGKQVFVGIDVHKTTYSACVVCEGVVVAKASMPAEAQALVKFLERFTGGTIFSAYEAGYFGFSQHRTLVGYGIKNIVVNPASIEVAANDRVKTDKRDAKKIAELLSLGRLKGIRIPSEREEERRLLTRTGVPVVTRVSKSGDLGS